MTPVDMEHLNHGKPGAMNGDCLRCCIASILDLPREEVPHFMLEPDRWFAAVSAWLRSRGLFWTCWAIQTLPDDYLAVNRPLVIAGGKSPRGAWGHWVIGELSLTGFSLIHDPHPSRAGLVGPPEDMVFLCRLFEVTR